MNKNRSLVCAGLLAMLIATVCYFSRATTTQSLPQTPVPKALGLKKISPEFPAPIFAPTPLPLPDMELAKRFSKNKKPTVSLDLPAATELVSLGCAVTSSDAMPFIGELSFVSDGENEGADGYYVELQGGVQWIQIDLGKPTAVDAVWVWRFHKQLVYYFDVVVGLSDSPDFSNPTILYNSDIGNHVGLGVGSDPLVEETVHGQAIPAGGKIGRYVRLYSNGRGVDEWNHYTEVSVYGRPDTRH